MYPHHEESLENLKKYFSVKEEVIAVILGGSVAKGSERPNSDLDAMVVITEEAYGQRLRDNTTAEAIDGYCTYEGGYFDIKYMTKAYLVDAARKGSEPTRSSFMKARVLFTKDADIPQIVADIPVFQKQEKEEKMLSFYANFNLNYRYFLKSCSADGYMKLHTVGETIYSLYRIFLQENEILFPCNRRLEATLEKVSEEAAELVRLGREAAKSLEMEDLDAFVDYFWKITSYQVPKDFKCVLSRYIMDFEQWWRYPRPNVNEW